MNCTREEVIVHLNKLLEFLEPVKCLANSHLGSFFTEDLWKQKVPKEIQAELNNKKSLEDFILLYPSIIQTKCPVEFSLQHSKLLSFIQTSIAISIGNDNKYTNLLSDVKKFFSKKSTDDGDFCLKGFMSKKKFHEVEVTSKIIAPVSNLTESSHIIDIGGGKGYLSLILTLHHSYKVLSIDSSQVKTCGAVKRSEKVAKLWKGGVFEKGDFQTGKKINNKKSREEFIKEHYKQVITFVTPETNVVELLKQNFNEEVKGITLIGLHTCGDLAATCLQMFLSTKEIRSIVNVGCCYHLINEEFFKNNFFEEVDYIKEIEAYGFPLSNYLKTKRFVLGQEAKMLAEQSVDRIESQLTDVSQNALLYRAILETVIKSSKCPPKQARVGRLAKKTKNFKQYMNEALKKLNLNVQITDEDLDKLYNKYKESENNLTAYFLLRVTLAPVLESIILLDRVLYLIENGVSNTFLVQLFDLEISPRGFGIIAWKDK